MSSSLLTSPYFATAIQQLVETRPAQTTQTIYSSQGIKLVERGVAMDSGLYKRLQRHRLSLPLDELLMAQDAVSGKSLREVAELAIERQVFLSSMLDKPADRALALELLEALRLPPPIAFQLSVMRDVHPTLFSFSITSALVAGWLAATSADALRYDSAMLSTGGLLQDIGMMHLDPALLQSGGPLTAKQRRQLHSHPLIAVMLLERHQEYPREFIRGVREHHETMDGTGYPSGHRGEKISHWGKVLGLSQVVSAFLRPGRGSSTQRLSVLLRTTRQYDPALSGRVLALAMRVIDEGVAPRPTETADPDPVQDPVPHLIAMDQLLTEWPVALGPDAALDDSCRAGMTMVSEQCRQMRRILVEAGASVEQLALLGVSQGDEDLNRELMLIARELAWQMGTLAAQMPQRSVFHEGNAMPDRLVQWTMQLQRCSDALLVC